MTFGKDLAYNELIPEVGKEFTLYVMPMLQLGNKINISPSIRYARLKNLENNLDYFNGYISRFSVRYQFNNFLNIRLVSEYNAFTERFFVQPLIQWNPKPSTVFYVGGNQNSIDDINNISAKYVAYHHNQETFRFFLDPMLDPIISTAN